MNIDARALDKDTFALKVDSMLKIMDKLCSILLKENEILEKNKVRNIEKLIDPKVKLISIYTEQYNIITANKSQFQSLDKSRRDEIAKRAILLQTLMTTNERLLHVNINSTSRLISMIVADARKHENEQSGIYSASGQLGHENKKTANLSYNQVL